MRYSKTLQKIAAANPEYIEQYYFDSDGHWMYSHSGYIFPSMECGTLHEWSVTDMLDKIREGIHVGEFKDGFTAPVPNAKHIKLKMS